MAKHGRARTDTLTAQQGVILASLADGSTVTDAAAKAGVERATASRWLNNPAHPLAQAWTRVADEAVEEARLALRRLTTRAVQALDGVLDDPDARGSERVAAAREILSRAGVVETTRSEVQVDATTLAAQAVARLSGASPADVLDAVDEPDDDTASDDLTAGE